MSSRIAGWACLFLEVIDSQPRTMLGTFGTIDRHLTQLRSWSGDCAPVGIHCRTIVIASRCSGFCMGHTESPTGYSTSRLGSGLLIQLSGQRSFFMQFYEAGDATPMAEISVRRLEVFRS